MTTGHKPAIVRPSTDEGRQEWALIPYADFEHMLGQLEDLDDLRAFDQAKQELAMAEDELLPASLVKRLANGEHPLRVWREYRGLTQQALAEAAGFGKSHISQLESGNKTGAVKTLRAIATALRVHLEDLEPWTGTLSND